MKKIDELKDVVAKEMGYKNFKDAKTMQYLPNEFIKASERLAILYAEECCKASLIKAADNAEIDKHTYIGGSIIEESIISESNIVLL